MNKEQLKASVAEKTGLSKVAAQEAIDAVFSTITETLKNKEDVAITGFGKFYTIHKDAGTARVPGTDRTVKTVAKELPKFKAGKALKDAVA